MVDTFLSRSDALPTASSEPSSQDPSANDSLTVSPHESVPQEQASTPLESLRSLFPLDQPPLPDWIDPSEPGIREPQLYEGNGTSAQPYTLNQLLRDPQKISPGVHYFNADNQPSQILGDDRTLSWAYLARSAIPALAERPISELRELFIQTRQVNTFEFEADASMYNDSGATASGRLAGTRYPSGRAGSAIQWGLARSLAMVYHDTDNPSNSQVHDILRNENIRVDLTLANGRQAMLTIDDIGSLHEPYSIAAAQEYLRGIRSGEGNQYFQVEMTEDGTPRLIFNEGFRLIDIHANAVPGVQGVQRVTGRITLPNFSVPMVTQVAPEEMSSIATRYLDQYSAELQRFAYDPR